MNISSLGDLGLKLPGDGEIDLLRAFVLGDFLHVVLCEVRNRKKQKEVEILMEILESC